MMYIIHLLYKGEHYYFKTLSSVFDYFTSGELGITYGSLRNYRLSPERPYKNAKCCIFKGPVLQNRRNKAYDKGKNTQQND